MEKPFCKEIDISNEQAFKIADKIWQNEGSSKKDNLTCWNKGENFASLGIGHFIWYPADQEKVFKQTFPELINFLKTKEIAIPSWLIHQQDCPWSNREIFYKEIKSARMQEFRLWLYETRQWQALFMVERLERALPNLLSTLPQNKRTHVKGIFDRLIKDPNGAYALIDYFNFKGDGTVSTERYHGQGWGLLQVLLGIPENSSSPLDDFIKTAKQLLTFRVKNSLPERNEERWLQGWLNRVETYRN